MLGAGMDTRPWRLPLDPRLKWFELDRSDVLAAKQKALQVAGAGFEPGTSAQAATGAKQDSSSSTANSSNDSSSSSSSSSRVQVPLRVGQWACASADLQKTGWVQKLLEVGLQPDQPMVSLSCSSLTRDEWCALPVFLPVCRRHSHISFHQLVGRCRLLEPPQQQDCRMQQ
jgi:hypothetical protein